MQGLQAGTCLTMVLLHKSHFVLNHLLRDHGLGCQLIDIEDPG